MIGIDLFAGSGGLSEGAEQAGIEVRLAVESEPHAIATYARNHPNTRILACDIRKLREIDIDPLGHTSIIFGGPPCQGFSTSNQKTRNLANSSNWLFLEFLRIVRLWTPDWVLFENVTGIAGTEGGFFLEQLSSDLKRYGYTCSNWILNAADYGVPQLRNRLFVVGSLHGISVKAPKRSLAKHVTVHEAIADLPILPNGASTNWMRYRCDAQSDYSRFMRGNALESPNHLVTRNNPLVVERYRYIPEGGNWTNIPDELMGNYRNRSRCHTRIYYRLRSDAPSVVIGNYRKNMLIHPTQDRGLSVREAARLQSFGDWYEFCGTIGFQQQQVGNAVPPLLARVVFETILSYESSGIRLSSTKLSPEKRMSVCVV